MSCFLLYPTQCISKYCWLYLQIYAKASTSCVGLQPVQSHRNQFLESSHAFVSSSVVAVFKFFMIFEQEAPYVLFCTGVPILRWSCSNPSTSYCLIATCPGPNQDHILSRIPEQPPNWSPHSQFPIQTAIIKLLNIKQILSFMCSSGFSSQVKLHPNSWPLAPSFLTTFPLSYLYSI